MLSLPIFLFDPQGLLPKDQIPASVRVVDDIHKALTVVSVGGDGTLLKAFKFMEKSDVLDTHTLYGVNMGTVGFLTNRKGAPYYIPENPFAGTTTHKLSLLSVTIGDDTIGNVLNDISLHPMVPGKLFEIAVRITDEDEREYKTLNYKGDGIIICTATGSTAYNLSAGGPILERDVPGIIISPMQPFSLSARPLVFSEKRIFKITTKTPYRIVLDGTPLPKEHKKEIIVECAFQKLSLMLSDNFFDAIHEKLGWNHSIK